MKQLAIFLVFFTVSTFVNAQCADVSLSAFQALQRADPALKASKIQDLGFDPHSDFVIKGVSWRRFHKCWLGKSTYGQAVLWNTTTDQLMLLMYDEGQYQTLRGAIEGRHNSGEAQKGDDYYIGHQFKYRYSVQQLDGVPYFTIAISPK